MTPSEREEIEKVAEEMVKYVFDCVQHGNSSMAHQFVEYSIITQVAKARAEEREICAKIAIESESQYCLSEDEKDTTIRIAEAIRRRLYE